MDNTIPSNKKTTKKTKCPEEKDQESAVLQALGNLERRLEWLIEILVAQDSDQEDGEECQDDEESSSM